MSSPADRFEHLYGQDVRGQQPSAIREICHLVDQPEMRSLAGGWPDPQTFPSKEVAEIVTRLMNERPEELLQYGTTEGLVDLRRAIARMIKEEEGLSLSEEEIIITHGAQQGMDLLARVLFDHNDVLLAGLPTYFGGTGAVAARGGHIVGVPIDQDGMDTDILEERLKDLCSRGWWAKGVYVIPNFQNPTGATLTLERRKRMVQLAEEYDLILFEDDPYGELRFEGEPLPSLLALDRNQRVVHIRSLSKTFVPGMRIAWMTAEPGLLRKLVVAKQFVDACSNSFGQHIAGEFISSGYMKKSIRRNNEFYRNKRDAILAMLDRHFPVEVRWNRPEGGFFLFVHLPEYMDAIELLNEALLNKVAFVAGTPFFIDGGGKNTFRISYSQTSIEDMETAVSMIGSLIKKRLKA